MSIRRMALLMIFPALILDSWPVSALEKGLEIYEQNFYRAPGGFAHVTFPDLWRDSTWKQSLSSGKGYRQLEFVRRSGKSVGCVFDIMFFIGKLKGNADAEMRKMVTLYASELRKVAPHLAPAGGITKSPYLGNLMAVYSQHLSGAAEEADVSFITDGSFVVCLILRGNRKDYKDAEKNLVLPVLKTLRVGKTVLGLKDQKPAGAIEGVYIGDYESGERGATGSWNWYIFDKRGYCTPSAPSGMLYLDFDAHMQWKGDKAYLFTYEIKGGTLTRKRINGETKTFTFKKSGKDIYIDKEKFTRVDGNTRGLKLDGHYRASSVSVSTGPFASSNIVSGKDFYFTPDGKFSFSSYASASALNYVDTMPLGLYVNTIKPTTAGKMDSGRYRIENDLLWLSFPDGTKLYKSIYCFPPKSGKADLLYINGDAAVIQKK